MQNWKKRFKPNFRIYKGSKEQKYWWKKDSIEALWKIIYSDEKQIYETNLMRRLSGYYILIINSRGHKGKN